MLERDEKNVHVEQRVKERQLTAHRAKDAQDDRLSDVGGTVEVEAGSSASAPPFLRTESLGVAYVSN